MKFRTDFVTNSSDTSYLAFNIKNQKLWDFLTSLGLKLDGSEEGIFSDSTQITLPSGRKGVFCEEAGGSYDILDTKSVSEWLIKVFMDAYQYSDDCDYEDDEEDEDDYEDNEEDEDDYEDEEDEDEEQFNRELSQILTSDNKRLIAVMDDAMEYANIRYEDGFEGEMHECGEVDIRDGIRTLTTPEKDYLYGEDLAENYDFDGTPGEVITQQWKNGRWVTV